MPMSLAARVLHVEADKNNLLSAELVSQINRLKP